MERVEFRRVLFRSKYKLTNTVWMVSRVNFRCFFFFSSRRRHTRYWRDWSSDVCSSDLQAKKEGILTETFLMNYIFAGEGEYLTKNSRIIADPDGGYWSILEGYEGDGGVKTGIDGVSELNIFSPESTSIGELQEAVLAWYEARSE